ncbi:hypothetical protein HHL26_06680 [Sphingobium sp. TB-6]|uniref:hypothetical protein n=1 Tax=Sphingobium sp. TB-6 TaxID=2728850 RepID=UPI00146EF33F|nr:hypothetical protein [Sphingobium sp. TB-6]NML88752.1 hypothetical protein [Sphingobium sp. TB-6]
MTGKVKVKLLRPLDDEPIGAEVEFDATDAKRLKDFGAVKILGAADSEPETSEKPAPASKPSGKPAKKEG